MYTEKTYKKKLENFTNKKYLASFLVLLSALTIASMMSAFKISSQYLSFYQIIFIKSSSQRNISCTKTTISNPLHLFARAFPIRPNPRIKIFLS